MVPNDLKPVFPIFKGHIACICAHSIALNLIVIPETRMPYSKRRPVWILSGTGKTNNAGKDLISINSYLVNPICDSDRDSSHIVYFTRKPVYFTRKPYHHFIPKAYHFDTRLMFIFH
jgi:hypothetical protein